jgi:nucleoid DNA-binding protein
MTRKDMARALAVAAGVPQVQAKDIVQGVFQAIVAALVQDGRIELRNFGVFAVKERGPRTARNLRTGQAVEVPARLVVTFQPGRQMEQRVGRLTEVPAPSELPE